MKKQILAILFSLFMSPVYAGEKAAETPKTLCTITLYDSDPGLVVATKYKLRSGEYLISNCVPDARLIEIDWWQLSNNLAKEWNELYEADPVPTTPKTATQKGEGT